MGESSVGQDGGQDCDGDVYLRPIGEDEWEDLQTIRVRALTSEREVFLAEPGEERWQEPEWRHAVRNARWVVARIAGRAVGIARATWDDEEPHARHLEAVWVEPECRRRGIGSGMVLWLIDQERHLGATEILIWIIGSNDRAFRLYKRLGFDLTGERKQLLGEERFEERLRLGSVNTRSG